MPPYFEIDLEILRQLAGTIWVIAVALLLMMISVLAVLLPVFIWRIWWWTRATCREVTELNRKMEHLLRWLIVVRQESAAGDEPAGERFSFEAIPPGRPPTGDESGQVTAGREGEVRHRADEEEKGRSAGNGVQPEE